MNERDYAFSITVENGGTSIDDHSDDTSQNFIKSFRHLMQKPDLSRAQLASMLRAAERRRRRHNNDDHWTNFMSGVISKGCNNNDLQSQ